MIKNLIENKKQLMLFYSISLKQILVCPPLSKSCKGNKTFYWTIDCPQQTNSKNKSDLVTVIDCYKFKIFWKSLMLLAQVKSLACQ